jgi:hypothetical protein
LRNALLSETAGAEAREELTLNPAKGQHRRG